MKYLVTAVILFIGSFSYAADRPINLPTPPVGYKWEYRAGVGGDFQDWMWVQTDSKALSSSPVPVITHQSPFIFQQPGCVGGSCGIPQQQQFHYYAQPQQRFYYTYPSTGNCKNGKCPTR